VRHRTGTSELDKLGGLARAMPFTFAAGVVAALAISGVPPLNGFASKWMVYQGVLATGSKIAPLLLIAAVFGSALTLASFVKVIHSVFFGRPSDDVARARVVEAPAAMAGPMLWLAFLCILFGVFAAMPVRELIAPCVAELDPGLFPAKISMAQALTEKLGIWYGTSSQATVLLLIGLILGALFYLIGRVGNARVARPYVGGELAGTDEYRVPGTGFYETVRGLPLLGGMYRDAEAEVYDVYHLGGQYGSTLVQHLRNAHTGVLAVYVGWCVLGLALVLLYLLPF
jgi:NADH:ubiquinone oxidoreductase subunit 5 (subunit L)/multisubunit Na+/H+ antiporter MnhA subunit